MTRSIRPLRLLAGIPLVIALSGVAATALPAAAQTGCEAKVMATGTTFDNVDGAVAAAPAGTTIQVRGVCLGPVFIDKNLTLVGKASTLGGPGIYGQESVRALEVFEGTTATVKSLEIAFGWAGTVSPTGEDYTTDEGGGILNWGTLTLTDVVVADNTADGDGGGIANYGILRIDGASQVHHNRSGGFGGGILSEGRVTIAGQAVIHSNTADDVGGGIFAARDTFPKPSLTIRDTAVIRNNTSGEGGGIATSRIPVLLRDRAAVRANTASETAGGVYLSGGRLTMEGRASISGNAAIETGGVLSDTGFGFAATVTLKGSSVIKGNTGSIGGILLQAGALTMLDDSSIRGHRTLPSSATVAIGRFLDQPSSFTMKGLSRVTDNRVSAGSAAVLRIKCSSDPAPTFTGVKARTIGNTPKNILTGCP